jgi:hypothetical protein
MEEYMNHELAGLQAQLDRLSNELCNAQQNIRRLETRAAWRPNALALTCVALVVALGVVSFGTKATSENDNKIVASASPEVPTKVKAPFEVVDDQGRTIFRVMDQTLNGEIDRGAFVLNEAGRRVVDLTSTSDGGGGGRIKVTAGGSDSTSDLGQTTGVTIDGNRQSAAMQIVRQGKKVASIGGEAVDKFTVVNSKQVSEKGGMIQLYDASEKPSLTLSSGNDGGELDVFGAKPKPTSIGAGETSGGAIKIYGSTDKPLAVLGGNQSGGGSLSIYGTGDKPKAVLGTESNGGSLKIYGSSDKALATLETDQGNGKLSIGNKAGTPLADIFADENGGQLKIYHSSGQGSAAIQTLGSGSSLDIYGSADKPVATLQSEKGDGSLTIRDQSGHPVATVSVQDNGGVIKAMMDGDPNTFTAMGSTQKALGLTVKHAGAPLAYVGWNDERTGTVLVYAAGNDPVASVTTDGGKGVVGVLNNGIMVAYLSENRKHPGGGELTVADPGGNEVFNAGYTGEGGEACVNHKGSLKCLGIALPLTIDK